MTEETGEQDIEILIPNGGLAFAWERIWEVGPSFGLKAIGHAALESLRIEAGIPKVGPDLNERIVPPEANLEGKAFSLTKGMLSRTGSGCTYGHLRLGQTSTRWPID